MSTRSTVQNYLTMVTEDFLTNAYQLGDSKQRFRLGYYTKSSMITLRVLGSPQK